MNIGGPEKSPAAPGISRYNRWIMLSRMPSSDLRKRAAQARRAARIRTEGGQAADRQLLMFATQLEQHADEIDGKPVRKKPSLVATT